MALNVLQIFLAYVFPNTFPVPISLAHTFILRQDWSMNTPDPSPQAPADGFLFVNKTPASALLFKLVRNQQRPIFLTSVGDTVPPPGQHTLRPAGTILIFFASAEDQTAFSSEGLNTDPYVVSYESNPKATVLYGQDGTFSFLDENELVGGMYKLLTNPLAARESSTNALSAAEEL
jgi:hypothetical protein